VTTRSLLFAALAVGLVPAAASARPAPPDRPFGGARGLVYPVPGDETSGEAVAILGSGRIVAAGSSVRRGGQSFAVVRLSRRGGLERRRYVAFPEAPYAAAYDLAVSRGRILVAGLARDGEGTGRVALAALRPSLRLDPRFGVAGRALGPPVDLNLGVTAMAIDRAGRILVAGTVGISQDHIVVTRFHPDGRIDTRFARDGTFTIRRRSTAPAIAVARNGDVLVAGTPGPHGPPRPNFLLARLTARGAQASLDVRRVGRGIGTSGPVEILPRGDGGADVVGDISERRRQSRPVLLRYRRSGRLDRRFGRRGVRRIGRSQGTSQAVGLARRRDGRLVAAVQGPAYATWSFYGLLRNGRPDPRARESVASRVGRYDGAQLHDFAVRGRRLLGVGRDDIDERIDLSSYFMLGAFRAR
jgi:uncharacterized delta-60 repeat protein